MTMIMKTNVNNIVDEITIAGNFVKMLKKSDCAEDRACMWDVCTTLLRLCRFEMDLPDITRLCDVREAIYLQFLRLYLCAFPQLQRAAVHDTAVAEALGLIKECTELREREEAEFIAATA